MYLLRLVISVTQPNEQEWIVTIFPSRNEEAPQASESQAEPLIAPRHIRRLVTGSLVYPQPPASEAAAIAPEAPHALLCTTTDAAGIERVYRNIMARQPNKQQKDVEAFALYLSTTLLGKEGWRAIHTYADKSAPSHPLELALRFEPRQDALSRLPWEMMYGS